MRWVPLRLAPLRSAPPRLASLRPAPPKFASRSAAPLGSAPLRSPPPGSALLRSTLSRSSHKECCSLHVFQAVLPCFSTSRSAWFAMSCPPPVSCHYSACGELQQECSPDLGSSAHDARSQTSQSGCGYPGDQSLLCLLFFSVLSRYKLSPG